MITLLLLFVSALAADPPKLDLADPWNRLAFARYLAAEDGTSPDESAVAFMRLTDNPTVGAKAIEELYHIAITEQPRAGWRDVYDTLLSKSQGLSGEGRTVLTLRAAQARVADGSTRSRGLAQLRALVRANPERSDIRIALGDALLASDKALEARAVYQGTEGGARSTEGIVLALLTSGKVDEAKEYASTTGLTGKVADAAKDGSLRARVLALIQADFIDTAEKMLEREDPKMADGSAWLALVDTFLERNEATRAADRLREMVAADTSNQALRRRLVSALLEAGDLSAAKGAAGTDEKSLQEVYAVEVVSSSGSASADERSEEISRAWRLAPGQPSVVKARVEMLLALGRSKEAYTTILPILEIRPKNGELRVLYDRVALAAEEPDSMLQSHRESIKAAGPWDFWHKVHALAGMHTMMAEHLKNKDDFDGALRHYRTALSLRPDAPDFYKGLGGVLWSGRKLDGAKSAYLEAYRVDPSDAGALEAVVKLMIDTGDVEGAQALLDSTKLVSPVVRKLRDDVVIEQQLHDVDEALRLGQPVREAFQDLLVRYPDNPSILHALGDKFMQYQKPEEALNVYQRAREFRPSDQWLAMAEASAHVELGMPAKAHGILDDLGTSDDEQTQMALNRLRARTFRAEGDNLWQNLDRDEAAFEAYQKSLALDQNPWTLTSLAGLYLDHRQPSVALAFFDAALELEPENQIAKLGRITALQQLGRIDEAGQSLEAIGRRAAGAAVWKIQDQMEIREAIRVVDTWMLKGNLRRARQELDDIAKKYPESPHVDAAMGSLMLIQDQPGIALQRAERALKNDPTHGRALAVAMDAGLVLGRMDEVVRLMEAALDSGGGEQARVALENALFAANVESAVKAAKEGRRRIAERELEDLRESVSDKPDHWALLGGGYLSLNLGTLSLEVYDRALEFDQRHVPSLIGRASAIESLGNIREAAKFLEKSWETTKDPRIGFALASIQGRLGRWKLGSRTLDEVQAGTTGEISNQASRWGRIEPLPVLPLPNGNKPEDLPPASMDGLSGQVSDAQIQDLRDSLEATHYPYGDVGGGFMSRTGNEGTNRLNAAVVGGGVSEFTLGPFRLQADVLSVLLNNGVGTGQGGVSAAVGIANSSRSKINYDARVGISPIGFDLPPYLTFMGSLSASPGPSISIGAQGGRAPINDSLLSWAGDLDQDGLPFGQASNTWGGGWIAFANPNLTDGGALFRAGVVEALGMDSVARQELAAWAGQTFGSEEFRLRLGANFSFLSHGRQIDQFSVGQAGVFSPRTYTVGLIRLGASWEPAASGAKFCFDGALGAQNMTGLATEFFDPNTFVAGQIGAGLRFPVAEDWAVGLDAKRETTGNLWSNTTVLFRLGHIPGWTGLRNFKAPSQIHGTGVTNMTVCND